MLKKIEAAVAYYANRAAKTCRSLDSDDVRQTLYEKALKVHARYVAEKGAPSTFFGRCFHNTVIDCQRVAIEENENLFFTDFWNVELFTDFSNVELSYDPMKIVYARLYLDDIETALKKQPGTKMHNALKVFKKLRLGWVQKDCAEYYKWSKGYISRLVNECIIPIGRAVLLE